jgi:hypothetical protein
MSTAKSALPVKILGLFGESMRSIQSNAQALAKVLLFLVGGFMTADVLTIVLKRIILPRSLFEITEIFQWLFKAMVMFLTAWSTVSLMRFLSVGSESMSIRDWCRTQKNMLPRILATFLSVAIRFLAPGMLIVGGTSLAVMAKSQAILLIFQLVFGISVSYLFVQYVFAVYLIFESGLKPLDIPSRSSELVSGHGWEIFFTMIVYSILTSSAFMPLFLLYPGVLEMENILAVTNFSMDVFSYPPIFVIFCDTIIALAVVFQAIVFMKFYDQITGASKS